MPPHNTFKPIHDILDEIFSKAKWHSKLKQYSLWQQWDSIVGTQIAKVTEPLRWQKNVLVVGVKDSCWLTDLRMKENEILAKIREGLPDLKIEGIRWTLK